MRRRRIWPPVIALLLLAVIVVFFTNIPGDGILPFLPKFRVQRTTTRASSVVTLESVRDLFAFNTVEYIHRAVFPYDYLADGVSLSTILGKLRSAETTVRDALTPDEYLFFEAYNLAVDIGMNLGNRPDFVVITVVITGGFDLSEWLESDPERVFSSETLLRDGTEWRRATLVPPPAVITEIAVEDITAATYPYPDVSISAEAWRRIAGFVQERARALPDVEGLLEVAAENGRAFVREMLLQAGYDEVLFAKPGEL